MQKHKELKTEERCSESEDEDWLKYKTCTWITYIPHFFQLATALDIRWNATTANRSKLQTEVSTLLVNYEVEEFALIVKITPLETTVNFVNTNSIIQLECPWRTKMRVPVSKIVQIETQVVVWMRRFCFKKTSCMFSIFFCGLIFILTCATVRFRLLKRKIFLHTLEINWKIDKIK